MLGAGSRQPGRPRCTWLRPLGEADFRGSCDSRVRDVRSDGRIGPQREEHRWGDLREKLDGRRGWKRGEPVESGA